MSNALGEGSMGQKEAGQHKPGVTHLRLALPQVDTGDLPIVLKALLGGLLYGSLNSHYAILHDMQLS